MEWLKIPAFVTAIKDIDGLTFCKRNSQFWLEMSACNRIKHPGLTTLIMAASLACDNPPPSPPHTDVKGE